MFIGTDLLQWLLARRENRNNENVSTNDSITRNLKFPKTKSAIQK